jgi:hypothetical protein
MRYLALLLCLASCSPQAALLRANAPGGVGLSIRQQAAAIVEALDHWDAQVGCRRDVPISLTQAPLNERPTTLGVCSRMGRYREISVYIDRITSLPQLRSVILHELAHAHLECSPNDHVDDDTSLMNPYVRVFDFDSLTLAKLRSLCSPL